MRNNDIQNGFLEWKNIERQIEELIKIREKQETAMLMDKGLSLFHKVLWLVNNMEHIPENVSFKELKLKPINVEERLSFIRGRQGSFHSFKQLVELFKELEKQYAKKASLEKI
ncbi:YpoC family protein [Robertmurraya sp. P23]|uniref:YpoC family protein n=1 Tax=Robertmurraya sp. P23 TaxID=3436931 RepID=UPI003D9587E7